jgi:hypothetical protein
MAVVIIDELIKNTIEIIESTIIRAQEEWQTSEINVFGRGHLVCAGVATIITVVYLTSICIVFFWLVSANVLVYNWLFYESLLLLCLFEVECVICGRFSPLVYLPVCVDMFFFLQACGCFCSFVYTLGCARTPYSALGTDVYFIALF